MSLSPVSALCNFAERIGLRSHTCLPHIQVFNISHFSDVVMFFCFFLTPTLHLTKCYRNLFSMYCIYIYLENILQSIFVLLLVLTVSVK